MQNYLKHLLIFNCISSVLHYSFQFLPITAEDFFWQESRWNAFTHCVWGSQKTIQHPLNPYIQTTKSHRRKARSYKSEPSVKQCCHWSKKEERREGIIPTTSHIQHRAPSIPFPISTKRKGQEQTKKEDTWPERRKGIRK